jgi:hypothetical protein
MDKPHPAVDRKKLAAFREHYLSNGFNAYRAALAIGMKPRTGQSNAHRYANLRRLEIQQALRIVGLDEVRIALKLDEVIDATTPKWNPAKRRWDIFPDFTTQLEALKQIVQLLNLYPAEASKVDPEQVTVIVDVPL